MKRRLIELTSGMCGFLWMPVTMLTMVTRITRPVLQMLIMSTIPSSSMGVVERCTTTIDTKRYSRT